jgi:molybdopterin/thiamine biosynthesis adenylyltransferase
MDRYARQRILPEVGEVGQEKLGASKVCVIGAGGLGCPSLQYLAASGVGQITILDEDLVEESNLGRQILFSPDDLGQPKAEVAKKALERLNPNLQVDARVERFRADNAESLAQDHHVFLEGSDNFSTKFLVNDTAHITGTPAVIGGVLRWEGQVFTEIKGSPCYRCLFIEPPPPHVVPNCSEVGTMGPVAGLISNLQSLEVLKICLGLEPSLAGAMASIDGKKLKIRTLPIPHNPLCPLCGDHPTITQLIETGVTQCSLKGEAEKVLITYEGNQRVIKVERALKSQGYQVEPRVTPRQLSNECGICLEVTHKGPEQKDQLLTWLEKKGLSPIRCLDWHPERLEK